VLAFHFPSSLAQTASPAGADDGQNFSLLPAPAAAAKREANATPLAHMNYWNEASCLFLPVHWRRGIRFRDSSFHQKQPSAVCWEAAIAQGKS